MHRLSLHQQLSQHGAAAKLVQAMPKTPIPVLSDEEIQAAATFVVKRFRKFHKRSAESQTRNQQVKALHRQSHRYCDQPPRRPDSLCQTLQSSKAPEEHARRMLTRFSPSTLEKYLSCIATFLDFRQSDEDLTQGDLTVQGIADYLLSCQRSAVQDRAPHRVSPLTSLKALRWFAKLTEWQELAECTASPLVASYGHSTTCKDKRESYPVPLALVVAFEQCVCDVSTAPSMALFLGAVLLCIHGSIRFGDAQRMPWDALQLSATALHGTCDQTKTTKQGQPFAVTLHGVSGRNPSSSWVLRWLGHLARYIRTAKLAPTARPDFAFINCTQHRPAMLARSSTSGG